MPSHYLNQCRNVFNSSLKKYFSEILRKIHTFSFKKVYLKMSSVKWRQMCPGLNVITHWGRVTHICVSNLATIGSDNGLSPGRRQAIIWTNAGILFIGPLGTNFSEILIEILTFSMKKMHLKVSSGKWRPFCLSLNVSLPVWYPNYWCILSIFNNFQTTPAATKIFACKYFDNNIRMTHANSYWGATAYVQPISVF